MIRVLVVDDSALMRRMLSDFLEEEEDIHVIGTARDGLEALAMIEEFSPDVVTLDIEMPRLSGLEVLERLDVERSVPIVVVSGADAPNLAFEALRRGAFDFIVKPSGPISVDLYRIREQLITSVREAARARARLHRVIQKEPPVAKAPEVIRRVDSGQYAVVAIAASTGGPQALETILSALPASFPVPIVVVQHMPVGFTRPFAERLDRVCALHVVEAESEMPLEGGVVYIAPAGWHLLVANKAGVHRTLLDALPPIRGLRPSADMLMRSVAETYGAASVGVVLTGMGDDGADGLCAIRAQGGMTIAQDEETSVIYGMPKVAYERGCAALVLPLFSIAPALLRAVGLSDEGGA